MLFLKEVLLHLPFFILSPDPFFFFYCFVGCLSKLMFIIQLIPQHLAEGDDSKERTVQVTGDKRQVDIAREMIKEVMSQVCF